MLSPSPNGKGHIWVSIEGLLDETKRSRSRQSPQPPSRVHGAHGARPRTRCKRKKARKGCFDSPPPPTISIAAEMPVPELNLNGMAFTAPPTLTLSPMSPPRSPRTPLGGTTRRSHSHSRSVSSARREQQQSSLILAFLDESLTIEGFVQKFGGHTEARRQLILAELLRQFNRAKGFITLTQSMPLRDLNTLVLGVVRTTLACERAALHVYHEGFGIVHHPVTPHIKVSVAGGVMRRVLLSRERVIKKLGVALAGEEDSVRDEETLFGRGRDLLSVPIVSHGGAQEDDPAAGRVVGMLTALDKKTGAFTQDDAVELSTISQQVVSGLLSCLARQREGEMEQQVSGLLSIYNAVSTGSPSAVQDMLARARRILACERSCLYVAEGDRDVTATCFTKAPHATHFRMSATGGVVGHILDTGDGINVPSAYYDPHFNPELDKEFGWSTTTLVAVPVLMPRCDEGEEEEEDDDSTKPSDRVIGVLEMANKTSGCPFTEMDYTVVESVAMQVSFLLQTNATLHTQNAHGHTVAQALSASDVMCVVFDKDCVAVKVFGNTALFDLPEALILGNDVTSWFARLRPTRRCSRVQLTHAQKRKEAAAMVNPEVVSALRACIKTHAATRIPCYHFETPAGGVRCAVALTPFVDSGGAFASLLLTHLPATLQRNLELSCNTSQPCAMEYYESLEPQATPTPPVDAPTPDAPPASPLSPASPVGRETTQGLAEVRLVEACVAVVLLPALDFDVLAAASFATVDRVVSEVRASAIEHGGVLCQWDTTHAVVVFGLPHSAAGDAEATVRFALSVHSRVDDVFIGCHHGVVSSGFMQARIACLGTSTTTARATSLAAQHFNARVLITEHLCAKVRTAFLCRALDPLLYEDSVVLQSYEVLCTAGAATHVHHKLVSFLSQALDTFRARNWQSARLMFGELWDEYSDPVSKVYFDKTLSLKGNLNVPSLRWTGVTAVHNFTYYSPHPEKAAAADKTEGVVADD